MIVGDDVAVGIDDDAGPLAAPIAGRHGDGDHRV